MRFSDQELVIEREPWMDKAGKWVSELERQLLRAQEEDRQIFGIWLPISCADEVPGLDYESSVRIFGIYASVANVEKPDVICVDKRRTNDEDDAVEAEDVEPSEELRRCIRRVPG